METNGATLPAKRCPGRPKGLPRTGGRQKGTPNRTTADQRELIVTRYQPVEFLGKVMLGQKIRTGPPAGPGKPNHVYPSLEQRLRAAELLVRKVLPDLAANEITGDSLVPTNAVGLGDAGALESLRRMAYLFFLAGRQAEG